MSKKILNFKPVLKTVNTRVKRVCVGMVQCIFEFEFKYFFYWFDDVVEKYRKHFHQIHWRGIDDVWVEKLKTFKFFASFIFCFKFRVLLVKSLASLVIIEMSVRKVLLINSEYRRVSLARVSYVKYYSRYCGNDVKCALEIELKIHSPIWHNIMLD